MKTIFQSNKLVITSIFILCLSACDPGMLDLAPYDKISSGNVWTKSSYAEQLITGVYNNLLKEYGTSSSNLQNYDAFSSIIDPSSSSQVGNYPLLMGGATTNSGFFANYWEAFYEGISRANDVIANIHQVPDMNDAKKARYIAECKFIRAYYYYRLNALWRGVPVYTEPTEVKDCIKARAPVDEVWNVIVKDLTDCINEANLPDKYAANSSDYGRITKGAAYTLRGKVYLWQQNWKAAQKDFEEVGKLGYNLFTGSYADLFTEANERCDEMIFSLQMIEQSGYGSIRPREYGNALTTGNGYNSVFLNTRFIDSYENADGKPFNWDDYLPGYSAMEAKARSVFFLRDGMTAKEKNTMQTYGADMTRYLSTGNEARILAAYQNRDPRLTATAITPYSTYLGGMTGESITYTYRWPYKGYDSREPFDFRIGFINNFMLYSIRKFVPTGLQYLYPTYNPIDIPVFRYA
ncbi:MAG: RagB/SusD family nutrient uptake outer membrane protein, partial [Candidatus Symbiothrix sp.]|nr:RagB/SusD family nutrient uptake outer membrane protein [Candidatus Symbiothrix sp.]